LLKRVAIGVIASMTREGELHPMHLLQTMTQHGTVDLLQQPMAQLDRVVGGDANEVPIKRRRLLR